MKVDVRYRAPWRRWQSRLVRELEDAGHSVRAILDPTPSSLSRWTDRALRLQQRVLGPRESLSDATGVFIPSRESGAPDLTIVLDGAAGFDAPYLEPRFAGRTGEGALLSALSVPGAVHVSIGGPEGVVSDNCLAVEHPDVLSRALDQVLARLVTVLVRAVRRDERSAPTGVLDLGEAAHGAPAAALIRGTTRKIVGRLPPFRRKPNHWRIAFRRGDPGHITSDAISWRPPFQLIDGSIDRFYADPMPVAFANREYVFFEDYPYATQKGVISLVELARDGTMQAPRTVLTQDAHLSYPLIVPHGDAVFMLPEMSAARRVQLFRADPFPDRWVPDRILLDDIVASDATPIFHQGRWWMFATVADDGGSTWDALHLFHAPDLLGPWTAHRDNPVLVDAGAARPAGPMWHEGETLMRVAQDCRHGYGCGLAVCRIDRLDEEAFAQTIVSRMSAPNLPDADGVHTFARHGSLEVVDIRFRRRASLRPGPVRD